MIFQTQKLKRTAPTMTVMLMIRPAGLRHSFGCAGVVTKAGPETDGGSGAREVGGVLGSSMRFQFLKKTSHTVSVHRIIMQK